MRSQHSSSSVPPTILDRLGMGLSLLCAVHCLILPFFMISLPIMARYYLAHPWFHLVLAVLIVPIGLVSFWLGFRHHGKKIIFALGLFGLLLVGVAPAVLHSSRYLQFAVYEPWMIGIGSLILVWAHWKNRRSCLCAHSH